jgi:acetyl esterase/lipase
MAVSRPTPRANPRSVSAAAPVCRRPRCAGFWETYLESPEQQKDWRAAPAVAELSGLPTAHLIVGSLDPLLDDSHRLAARLKEAGVQCELKVYEGLDHGFIRYGRLIAAARRAVGDCAAAVAASRGTKDLQTLRWREMDSNLYGAFPVKWLFFSRL